ncbi:MBL fold metallo-hydrolase [Streptantibioticus cattleyicolor]|nr:MBL fold metallo-hydrolase [Streptantibioticus cattleyicolor]CCB72096.1 Zn-dependent hydrolase, glyoxylase [Streptantibioticus cattleyicolor NRRL 8057 = DSM 46488]
MFRFTVGQAYLWDDAGSLTLVDCGPPGSAPAIAAALRERGHEPEAVRSLVLTHCHADHSGSAAEIRAWGATVIAHRLEAPVLRGASPQQRPVLTDWERPLFDQVTRGMPDVPPQRLKYPVPVDEEVDAGDVLDFGGGARVVPVPGHTDGSIALHLPRADVLFTGDTLAGAEGRPMLGVFNTDRDRLVDSVRSLADLGADVLCFGHGDPVLDGGGAALRTLRGEVAV